MKNLILNQSEYLDKVKGCWTGKSIGGTLGGPFEGKKEILNVTGYTTPKGEPLPNDDLDLQLVWLKAVIDRGPLGINAQVLSEYWLNYIPPPWGEYGICKANLRAGFLPPISGTYQNDILKHSNGAWIRSEIWACLFPGSPDAAIQLAYEDASVDHGAGEGMFAELFTASLESAAFVISDPRELIRIGLSKIPEDSHVTRAVKIAMESYDSKITWQEARARIVEDSVPKLGWFQAPANIGFVILGWLYGEDDFGKSLCIATNCGDDTDCTAATLGSILGIIRGAQKIPKEWTDPIGERIITIAIDRGSNQPFWPKNVEDLTQRVSLQASQALVAFKCPVQICEEKTDLSLLSKLNLADTKIGKEICSRSSYAVKFDFTHARVTLDYQRDPILKSGVPFTVSLYLENTMPDHRYYEIIWKMPSGIRILSQDHCSTFLLHLGVENNLIHRGKGTPHSVLTFNIVNDSFKEAFCRGNIEIRAQARPTIGYIPIVFACSVSS